MKKSILIKQHDIADCGVAALVSVSAFYNLHISLAKVRDLADADSSGTSAYGLVKAAEKLGFETKAVKASIEHLSELPKPAIAHVKIGGNIEHYVVIYKVENDAIEIMDPAVGRIEIYSFDEFQSIWTNALILMLPSIKFKEKKKERLFLDKLYFLIKPFKENFLLSIIFATIYTVTGLSMALFVQYIIDSILPESNSELMIKLSLGMFAIVLVQVFTSYFKSLIILKIGNKIDKKLITQYYSHVLNMPQKFFDKMKVGEIISRINDAVKIRVFLNEILIDVVVSLLIVLSAFTLMFTVHWKLTLIISLILPFYLLIYWISDKHNKKVERKLMEETAKFESDVIESISHIRTISQFNLNNHFYERTEKNLNSLLRLNLKSGLNLLFSRDSTEAVSTAFTILLLFIGTFFVLNNSISLGELMSFYALIAYFTGPANNIIVFNQSYQNAIIASDRLFDIIELEDKPLYESVEGMHFKSEDPNHIAFKNVDFGYQIDTLVFNDLTFKIQAEEITTIIGDSGSGKSSIANILMRLYKIEEGNISIKGIDIYNYSISDYNKLIGIVPQSIDIFSGSISFNIALDDPNPDLDKIISLASMLNMEQFINNLPSGFDTLIGEGGNEISGGERRRIGIMRCLYKDPNIVIFDEVTSGLDFNSEIMLLELINNLKNQGKTIIIITHKLSMIKISDNIIILEMGKVIDNGSHKELLMYNDTYRKFWDLQTGISSV